MTTCRPCQRGAALLEFAMALPFALTLFVGIGDFAGYFWHQTEMENVARLTASRLPPGLATADGPALDSLALSLETDIRTASRRNRLTVSLSKQFACPLPTGAEESPTDQSHSCPNERTYLRVAAEESVEPLLGPLRWIGFPKIAFSRHTLRLQ